MSTLKRKKRRLFIYIPLGALALLVLANFFLQSVWAHRAGVFRPDYARLELTDLLAAPELSQAEYDTLFLQTGLAPAAIDDLRVYGEFGTALILAHQDAFFAGEEPDCMPLGFVTMEERLYGEDGLPRMATPLAPLRDGDILLSFSTHTYGWRHGHAGLVVDAANNISLEAVVLFSNSSRNDLRHWSSYSTLLVLRPKGMTPELGAAVTQFALDHLEDIPYYLTSGVFGEKAIDPEGSLGAQCAYLPWYAYQHFGYDLDSDGGRIVTVYDLSQSDLLEVVQVFGLDPRAYLPRAASPRGDPN